MRTAQIRQFEDKVMGVKTVMVLGMCRNVMDTWEQDAKNGAAWKEEEEMTNEEVYGSKK